jgi:hypothetical protein
MHAPLDLGFLRLVLAAGTQAEGDVVHHAHVLEQRVVLEHEPTPRSWMRLSDSVAIVEIDGAGIRRFETGDGAQQRRLARAGRAEQRNQLARLNGQSDTSSSAAMPTYFFGDVLARGPA